MKKFIFVALLMLCVGSVFAQLTPSTTPSVTVNAVAGENINNLWKNVVGSGVIDTISTTAGLVKYLVALNVNTAIASDSIKVFETTNGGSKMIAFLRIPATPAPAQFVFPIGVAIDSSFVCVQIYKTSNVTSIYRKNF